MKKLVRGLEDISPLFQSLPKPAHDGPEQAFPSVSFDVQFLSVCVPNHDGDAFLANAFLASQLIQGAANLHASLVSIMPGMNAVSKPRGHFHALELLDSKISRLSLSHQELWTFTKGKKPKAQKTFVAPPSLANFLVFLEFEPSQFRSLSQIALLLDRMILFLQPSIESLREGYRIIKTFWSLNREIEFFLLFRDREVCGAQEGFLFERFSLITSRFLGISPGWLGNLTLPGKKFERWDETSREKARFNPEPILSAEGLKRPLSPEKSRCWQAFEEILSRRFRPQSPVYTP